MYIVPLSGINHLQSIQKTGQVGSTAANASTNSLSGTADSFSSIFKNALNEATDAQAAADKDSYDLAMNNTEDIASVMINSLRASTAIQTVTQLTSRAVSSYKEIMQMQV